jgi:hypothetical protein
MPSMEMLVMDRSGHTRHIWDTNNTAEIEAMRALFINLTSRGYRAFRVSKDGSEGERMEMFDPAAEKMILAPALQGG